MASRKRQIRFTENADLLLLREVVARNPYEDKQKWNDIAINLKETIEREFEVDSRRARERTHLLLERFEKQDREELNRSGIEDEYTELHQLLQDISDLKRDEITKEVEKKKKKSDIEEKGKEVRKRALESLKESKSADDLTPTKKPNVISYLKEKSQNEFQVRREEIELKKEELKLQQERFELEREERKARMETETKERMMVLEMMSKC